MNNFQVLNIGDKVECLKGTLFLDGTRHMKGEVYTVSANDLSYYIVNTKDYLKLNYVKTLDSEELRLHNLAIDTIKDHVAVLRNKLHNSSSSSSLLLSKIRALEYTLKRLGN